jgi:hypothetical protein
LGNPNVNYYFDLNNPETGQTGAASITDNLLHTKNFAFGPPTAAGSPWISDSRFAHCGRIPDSQSSPSW